MYVIFPQFSSLYCLWVNLERSRIHYINHQIFCPLVHEDLTTEKNVKNATYIWLLEPDSLLGLTTIEMSPSLLQLWSLRWKYLEYLLFTVFCAIILLLIVTNPGDQPLADNTLTPAEQRNMNIWIWTVGCLLICNDFRVQTCSNIDLQMSNCLEVYFVSMKAKGWYNWSLLPGIITSSHPQTL